MIYLDNAASTQIHDDVIDSMLPFFKEQFGNPSSIHRYGRQSRKAIENARKQIAQLINAEHSEILITSGGTESNNTVLHGLISKSSKGKIITSSIEHDAILEPCTKLEKTGVELEYLPVNNSGIIEPSSLEQKISDDTSLVSIMFANNEIGTIQPISEFAKISHSHKVLFHTDAVQAIGKVPIDVKAMDIDFLSISSHKLNGPKGVGALYIRKGLEIDPVILGGGQEHGLRSGTENVASIVGFGKACEIAKTNLESNISKMLSLRDNLIQKVTDDIPEVTVNGDLESRLPNNAHFTFLGVNGEDLIIKLDEHGIAASTGSACSVNTQKASHVLQAMGFSHEQITGSLRLTIGVFNTQDDVDKTVVALKQIVKELRDVSPFKDKYSFS
ncbi:MAG: cysteine desulfurase [Nitrosopumilus sp. (ex Thoosa mismalolli)]|nr:cysteine desulfurase [Nitrosopumilus sp. (ex Thoosa mismalolli)]